MYLPTEITTPYLMVDVDRLEHNVRAMAEHAARQGLALRPHAKTHKTAEIAALQLRAGAAGLTVATLGEAEAFARAGCDDLFLAYPVWPSAERLERIEALTDKVRLRIGVESVTSARKLAPLSRLANPPQVVIEIDSGHHRTGVRPQLAAEIALEARKAGLDVAGVFTFPGHSYSPDARERAAAEERSALTAAVTALDLAGIRCEVASGGSTPTAALGEAAPLTELRPGVYVFNDAQQLELGVCTEDQLALTAVATVVSRPAPDRLVLDCGSKVLGADRMPWATGHGRVLGLPGARVTALSEHHATVVLPEAGPEPALGDLLAVVPNHVCTAINLADQLHAVRDGQLVATWPVMARGANS
ncbi:MAG TPA: alanine racemase [Trebonia sp.]|nr:alanine racemase [Trebonia sp.]